jgi:hypothetical protein
VRVCLLLLPVIGLLLGGCQPDLITCVFDERDGVLLNLPPGQCFKNRTPCYQDFDKDGVGDWDKPVLLAENVKCGSDDIYELYTGDPLSPSECEDTEDGTVASERTDCYRLVRTGGDCADTDDMNYPGNTEVCDGQDNDCSARECEDEEDEEEEDEDEDCGPGANFDDEDEASFSDDGDYFFSCTPFDTPRFFIRGGSHLNGEPVGAGTSGVSVDADEAITGVLRIRLVVGNGVVGGTSGIVVPSWFDWMSLPFENRVLWDPLALNPDNARDAPAGVTDFDIVLTEEDGLFAPFIDDDEEYLTLMAGGLHAEFSKPDPYEPPEPPFPDEEADPEPIPSEHLASLTNPGYCGGEVECAPVWSFENVAADHFDFDVSDLDDLALASCSTFGATRVPLLFTALDSNFRPCELSPGNFDCAPLYVPSPVGCAFIKLKASR